MTTAEQPITRTELREELRHYATKKDLAELETKLVKWIVGVQIGGIAALAAVTTAILTIAKILWG
jgi:hypothetical protein